jgi:hypothetical protein
MLFLYNYETSGVLYQSSERKDHHLHENFSCAAISVERSAIRDLYGRIISDGSRKILALDSF